jgi:hypothetical protein
MFKNLFAAKVAPAAKVTRSAEVKAAAALAAYAADPCRNGCRSTCATHLF